MRMAYILCNGPWKEHKELGDGVKFHRERLKQAEKLYPVEIVERNEEREGALHWV